MSLEFSKFTDQFFWDFKRMDNVNYNFEIIESLYRSKKKNNDDDIFNKPLIIHIMAIIECMLYDFMARMIEHRYDKVPNMEKTIISFIQTLKNTDVLKTLIARFKSHNLFKVKKGDTIYEELDFLRKVRNRIHIQNIYYELDKLKKNYKNEYNVFSDLNLEKTQICFVKIVDILCNKFPRGDKKPMSMKDFPQPWL